MPLTRHAQTFDSYQFTTCEARAWLAGDFPLHKSADSGTSQVQALEWVSLRVVCE